MFLIGVVQSTSSVDLRGIDMQGDWAMAEQGLEEEIDQSRSSHKSCSGQGLKPNIGNTRHSLAPTMSSSKVFDDTDPVVEYDRPEIWSVSHGWEGNGVTNGTLHITDSYEVGAWMNFTG